MGRTRISVTGPVEPLVEKVIRSFHQTEKSLGMCCISPVLAAKAIPGCEFTVGHDAVCEKWPYAGTAKTMVELGATHVNKNAPLHDFFDGLGVMVKEVLKLA